MRILCDENVALKYIEALEQVDSIEVKRSIDVLGREASDARISYYAKTNGYVVLTRDEGFFSRELSHGLIYYSQAYDPPPSELVEVVQRIQEYYPSYENVRESIADW